MRFRKFIVFRVLRSMISILKLLLGRCYGRFESLIRVIPLSFGVIRLRELNS